MSDIDRFDNMLAYQELYKRTGVTIEWEHAAGWEAEHLNMVIASGDLPDSFGGVGFSDCLVQGSAGAFAPLEVLYAEFAPAFTEIMGTYPEMAAQLYAADGHIYTLPRLQLDKRVWAFCGMIMRKDWLEEIGAPPPDTVDELHTVLKEFKAKDSNRYPFTGDFGSLIWQWKTGAAGYGNPDGHFYQVDGKVGFGPITPNWADAITYLNTLWNEELIEPTLLSAESAASFDILHQNITSGVSGQFFGSWGSYMAPFQADMETGELMGIIPPAGPEGWRDMHVGGYFGSGGALASTSGNLEQLMQFWDNVYSPAGSRLINWGVEGDTYEIGEDGTPHYTDKVLNFEGLSPMEYNWTYISPNWLCPMILEGDAYRAGLNDAGREANSLVAEYTGLTLLPFMGFTEAEQEVISTNMGDINTLVSENMIKFITGARPLSEISAFVDDIKSVGIDQVLEIYQSYMDAYTERLKSM
jgi:putative aldouronate transport system substrate-binding protein